MSDERERTIRLKLSRLESAPRSAALSTGFPSLDEALGGGLPTGVIVELFGPAGCGKTTLGLQIGASVQRHGGGIVWADTEHAFDAAYAASMGIDVERMPVVQPESAEQGLEIMRRLADSGAVDFLVLDSAAALVPRAELESGVGDAGPGLHGRVLASGLRRLARAAAHSGTCVMFLNQIRMRRDAYGQESESSAGGAGLKLHAAARIVLSRVAAQRVRFRIMKNKVGAAFGGGELDWAEGTGFVEGP